VCGSGLAAVAMMTSCDKKAHVALMAALPEEGNVVLLPERTMF
jgi:hypothetical protein